MLGEQMNAHHRMYPDVYYKVQPHIMMVCDEMDDYDDYDMPSQEMIQQMSERIYHDVCRMYPEYAEQNYHDMAYEAATAYSYASNVEYQQFYGGGVFGDLITIMLLNEIFGRRRGRRRRRRYYW